LVFIILQPALPQLPRETQHYTKYSMPAVLRDGFVAQLS